MIVVTPHTNGNSQQVIMQEFSPKKFIIQTRNSISYILSKWLIILIVGGAFGAFGIISTLSKKPIYTAEITFAMDEGAEIAAKSNTSQLAEDLGLPPMVDAGGVFSSMTNIVELMQSRLLIEKTLRKTVAINNKNLQFASFFIDSLNYRKKWLKNSPYLNNIFTLPVKDSQQVLVENSIMASMYELLTKKMLTIDTKGKGTTILSVTCVSEHELFSKFFLEALLEEVTNYYIEIKTKRAKINLTFIQKRTDSLRNAFNGSLYRKAAFTDAHSNPNLQIAVVSGEKQQTDVQILRTSYIELIRNLESAKTSLMRETPLIQYIDTPILPLKKISANFITKFILFFFVGAFLTVAYLLIRKTIAYVMLH